MAPHRESKSPMGRNPLPATVMNVKLCCAKCEEKAKEECEEVEGVVKVIADQSENKVIVYGGADPAALLKKMRRHLDKHAMYWPMDEANQDQVTPPLFPVDPREVQLRNRGNAGLQTGTGLQVDPQDGRPLVDSREVRQVERELKDGEMRDRAGATHHNIQPREENYHRPGEGRPPERDEQRGQHSRDINRGAPGTAPREVVFIPVDARDGTPIDPRRVHRVDPRDGRLMDPPRVDAAGRSIDTVSPHPRPAGHGPEIREVRPIDPREPGRPPDVSELRPFDPSRMAPHGDPREVQRMDPQAVMKPSEPLDRRDDLRPVDVRMVKPIDPRDGRPALDPRDMDSRDRRAPAAASYGPAEPQPRGGMRGVPDGLVPVRTGRDARNMHFAPVSPTHAPRDVGPRSPCDADYMLTSRSPRQHAPEYGPRSPRDEYGQARSLRDYGGAADYGPSRSPRFSGAMDYSGPRSPPGRAGNYDSISPRAAEAMRPALDRELSFSAFEPGRGLGDGAPTVPMPYEPLDPRDAARFDFHGGAPVPAAHPRSPRSGGGLLGAAAPEHPPVVRGYDDIGPRQFNRDYMSETALHDRGDGLYARSGLEGGSPRRSPTTPPYVSQFTEFRPGEADVGRDYQPKQSYFSDYHPSQNYQPGPLATQDMDELELVTNPNYKKHLSAGPEHF